MEGGEETLSDARKEGENIVPFPGVLRRLVEKGMEELKEKHAEEALSLFSQAVAHEWENPQARFGVVLSLIELGQQEEAVKHTDALLKEGIGDYYETLQVHVSLLVQLSKYEAVVHLLEAVLAENRLPARHAEMLYELLHFSRQMSDTTAYKATPLAEKPKEEMILELRAGLHARNEPAQWQALQTVYRLRVKALRNDIRDLACDEETSPFMRTYALFILYRWQDDEMLTFKKDEQVLTLCPRDLQAPGERKLDQEVSELLIQQLEHIDPVLLDIAKQLYQTYALSNYPFLPDPSCSRIWGCTCHLVASKQLGLSIDLDALSHNYQCEPGDVIKAEQALVACEHTPELDVKKGDLWFHT